MADLGALRSAKQALDEGLITSQDFDVVKVAFLKAQQIKAGLDAGFIRKEDYDKAVDAYIHALDFNVMATLPSLSAGGRPAAAAAPATAPTANHVQQQQPNPMAAAFGGSRGTSLAGAAAAAGAVGSMGATVQLLPGGRSSGSGAHGFDGMASGPLSNQTSVSEDGGMLDIPADLPDYCKGATAGKVGSRAGLSHLGLAVSKLQHPVVATCVSLHTASVTASDVLSKWCAQRLGQGKFIVNQARPERRLQSRPLQERLAC
jgi:hypothetical protein